MSLEKEITNTVKNAVHECFVRWPLMAKKITLAALFDVTPNTIDKWIKDRVFIEEVHFTRVSDGNPMFYVPECLEAIKPIRAKEKAFL